MGARVRRKPYSVGIFKLGWREKEPVAEYRDPSSGARKRVRLGSAVSHQEACTLLERFAITHQAASQANSEPTVADLWEAWMHDRACDGFSNDIYRHNWKALEARFAGRIATTITPDDCRDHARERFAAGRKPATVHTELSRLRHCLKWAARRRMIAHEPYVWVCQSGKPRSLVLSPEQMWQLVEGAHDPHVRLFIVLAISTGARHRAILDLTWDRVDWIAGTVKYDEDIEVDPMSKTWRKGRATVAINKLLRSELERAFAGRQTEHVIEHGGRRLKSIKDGFKAAVIRAGLDPSTSPHTIRHSVATVARSRGADLEQVAHLLGHEDSDTTRLIYSHLDASFSAGVADMLDVTPLDALPELHKKRTEQTKNVGATGESAVPGGTKQANNGET